MKLSELISKYGDDNITLQSLDKCIVNLKSKKPGNEITFATDEPFNINGTEQMALIVWMDRDKVQDILDKENA